MLVFSGVDPPADAPSTVDRSAQRLTHPQRRQTTVPPTTVATTPLPSRTVRSHCSPFRSRPVNLSIPAAYATPCE